MQPADLLLRVAIMEAASALLKAGGLSLLLPFMCPVLLERGIRLLFSLESSKSRLSTSVDG